MNTDWMKPRWAANRARGSEEWLVLGLQLLLLGGFTLFAAAVIFWIGRLIYISWVWQDVFSASIGIALVAVPVFIIVLAIVHYTFWGLVFRKEPEGGDGKQNLET